jgi:hypothetical protein
MGKTKVHPSVRIKQFAHIPNNGLEGKGQSLQCTHCSVDLNCDRKSVIQKHLDSTLHKKRQRKHHFNSFHNNSREFYVFQFRDSTFKLNLGNQVTLPETLQRNQASKEIWKDMVSTFVTAGVPLYIFRNPSVQNWINTNIKSSSEIPCESTLRKYLDEKGCDDLVTTRELCRYSLCLLFIFDKTFSDIAVSNKLY